MPVKTAATHPAALAEDGFAMLRGLLPPAAIDPLIDDLNHAADRAIAQLLMWGRIDGEHAHTDAPFATRVAMVFPHLDSASQSWLWRTLHGKQHKTAGMFALRAAEPLLDAVESVIGGDILAHPQAVLRMKLPGHDPGVAPWHQDDAYLAEDSGDTPIINVWIPLVDTTRDNGCLEVIRGSHRTAVAHSAVSDAYPHGIREEDLPDGERVACELERGDVLMTQERLVHRSLPNTADTVRWSLDSRYCPLDMPTGRSAVPGFVARCRTEPSRRTSNHRSWLQLLHEAAVDPREGSAPDPPEGVAVATDDWEFATPRGALSPVHARGAADDQLVIQGNGDPHAIGCWRTPVDLDDGRWYRASVALATTDIDQPELSTFAQIGGHFLTPEPGNDHTLSCTFLHRAKEAADANEADSFELYLRATPTGTVTWSRPRVVPVLAPEARPARVATVRFGSPLRPLTMAAQRERISAKLDQAGAQRPDIVAMTEFTPVQGVAEEEYGSWVGAAESVPDGPVCQVLAAAARRHHMHVLAGVVERRGKHVFNTAVLFDRSGHLVGQYEKTHLTFGELRQGISCGSDYPLFDLDFGRVAIHICYDEWFPEVARLYAHRGAEILFLPSAGGKPITWRTRALDNRVYLVTAATKPPSMIIDSSGVVLGETHGDGVVCADLDLAERQTNWYRDPTLARGMPYIAPQMRMTLDDRLLHELHEEMTSEAALVSTDGGR